MIVAPTLDDGTDLMPEEWTPRPSLLQEIKLRLTS